jgi:hypothetical protein
MDGVVQQISNRHAAIKTKAFLKTFLFLSFGGELKTRSKQNARFLLIHII